MRRPRLLMVAYWCRPDRGSEAAAAWGMVLALCHSADVCIVTKPENVAPVEAWIRVHPESGVSVVGVGRTNPLVDRLTVYTHEFEFLTYLSWLREVRGRIEELHARERFDLAVHGALGAYWLPSPVWRLGIPSVWGPVGGAVQADRRTWRYFGAVDFATECLDRLATRIGALLPSTRRTMRRSTLVLVENVFALRALPDHVRSRARVFPRAILSPAPRIEPRPREAFVLFPSHLRSAKGARLALRGLARSGESARLVFVNEGPDTPGLKQRAHDLGLAHRVAFRGRVPRDELFHLTASAAAILYLGLREEGGCSLSESMVVGAPVIVYAHGGPVEMIDRFATDQSRVTFVRPGRHDEIERALGEAIRQACASPVAATGSYLDQGAAARELEALVLSVLDRS